MAISKIIYGGNTLLDLTSDTVKANNLLTGFTAHGADGELITGTCSYDADTSEDTAVAAEVLINKTAHVKGSKITGTMANNGAVDLRLSTLDDIIVPIGYHDGAGKAGLDTVERAKIKSENIREGITILGVTGSMSGSEDVVAETKEVTPLANKDLVITPDTTSGYNYLAQVTVKKIPYVESENSSGGVTVTIA